MTKRKDGHVRLLPMEEVIPSPENARLYGTPDPDDPDMQTLAESIRRGGVHDPLIITADG